MDLLWPVHGARRWGALNGRDQVPAPKKMAGALLAREARLVGRAKGFHRRECSGPRAASPVTALGQAGSPGARLGLREWGEVSPSGPPPRQVNPGAPHSVPTSRPNLLSVGGWGLRLQARPRPTRLPPPAAARARDPGGCTARAHRTRVGPARVRARRRRQGGPWRSGAARREAPRLPPETRPGGGARLSAFHPRPRVPSPPSRGDPRRQVRRERAGLQAGRAGRGCPWGGWRLWEGRARGGAGAPVSPAPGGLPGVAWPTREDVGARLPSSRRFDLRRRGRAAWGTGRNRRRSSGLQP